MKLRILSEADLTRRGFIKAAAVAAHSGPLGAAKMALGPDADKYLRAISNFSALSDDTKQQVENFTFDIVNDISLAGTYTIKDGTVTVLADKSQGISEPTQFPIDAVLGSIASNAGTDDLLDNLLTGDNPDNLNRISPGFIGDMLNTMIRSKGMDNTTDNIRRWGEEKGSAETYWSTILDNSGTFRDRFGITGKELSDIYPIEPGQTPRHLHMLVNNGMFSKDYVGGWMKDLRDWPKQKAEREKKAAEGRAEYQKQQKQLKQDAQARKETAKSQDLEITPGPDDYIYGNPMHQPFESKLSHYLNLLVP